MLVNQNPFPPLLVIRRLPREQRDEVVLCRGAIKGRRSSSRHLAIGQLPGQSSPKASAVGLLKDARAIAVELVKGAQPDAVELVRDAKPDAVELVSQVEASAEGLRQVAKQVT